MQKNTAFYDAESDRYSSKRYPPVVRSHIQAFYRTRLQALLVYLERNASPGASLLEIGCADGVVVRAIDDAFPHRFSNIKAVDISEKMIAQARRLSAGRNIKFSLRAQEERTYDFVIEIGVVNYTDASQEFSEARRTLAPGGRYVVSVAGTESLWHRLKPREETGFRDFRSYREYEALLREHFTPEAVVPVGLFIPHLWKVPVLARPLQRAAEAIMRPIAPDWFQEKIYYLRAK